MNKKINFAHTIREIKKGGMCMPALRCTAVRCVYNKEQLCSKGDIQVQGDHAKSMDETACGSFRERSESDYSNA